MEAIKIRKRINSDTIHIPQLKKFMGKNVEIILLEIPEKNVKPKSMNKFISASGKIDIDEKAVDDLKNKSIL